MDLKYILGWVSVVIALVSYIPYLRDIRSGKAKPHIFSWLLWGVMAFIGYAAQLAEGAGPGAWTTGFSAVFCVIIAVYAFRNGEKNITISDWISFICAWLAILLWRFTHQPLWAIVLTSLTYALGYYPTFRKSWVHPNQETLFVYTLGGLKYLFALSALISFNWTTALYPITVFGLNLIFIAMVLLRRNTLQPKLQMEN